MSDNHITAAQTRSIEIVLTILAIVFYFGPATSPDIQPVRNTPFVKLAQAFLSGSITIIPMPGEDFYADELIPVTHDHGYFFAAYPPLPALLLVPLILFSAGPVQLLTRTLSVLNVLIFDACLQNAPQRLGLQPFSIATRFWFDVLFAFGTTTMHNALIAGDWHLAHAVALTGSLLALREYLDRNRPLLVGIFVGCVIATRPTAALACAFLYILERRSMRRLAIQSIGPLAAIIALGVYNYIRFANPFEFGYSWMLLSGEGAKLINKYGQFSPHFLAKNFFWFFLAPFWTQPPPGNAWLAFDPRGTSLFLTTPAFLYIFVAITRVRKNPWVPAVAGSIVLCLVPLLMYFNTGFVQFGHRFSMDYLPALMILAILGIGPRPSVTARVLILLSIVIQTWGVLWALPTVLPPSIAPLAIFLPVG